jgi:hypothetical protein
MPLCQICFQPECPESTDEGRPGTATHSTRLQPGQREYRGYIDWAVHPEEAQFILHRGYAIVDGVQRPVYFDHNEAYVTQVQVIGSGTEVSAYTGGNSDSREDRRG